MKGKKTEPCAERDRESAPAYVRIPGQVPKT
jgi:hypothetical protein